jgi:hypothetical protein
VDIKKKELRKIVNEKLLDAYTSSITMMGGNCNTQRG